MPQRASFTSQRSSKGSAISERNPSSDAGEISLGDVRVSELGSWGVVRAPMQSRPRRRRRNRTQPNRAPARAPVFSAGKKRRPRIRMHRAGATTSPPLPRYISAMCPYKRSVCCQIPPPPVNFAQFPNRTRAARGGVPCRGLPGSHHSSRPGEGKCWNLGPAIYSGSGGRGVRYIRLERRWVHQRRRAHVHIPSTYAERQRRKKESPCGLRSQVDPR